MKRAPQDRTNDAVRIALIAGESTQGGAEKQLFYMAKALRCAGLEVSVFSLTKDEFYESKLTAAGFSVSFFGSSGRISSRAVKLSRQLRILRPHIVHAIHAFANPYAAVAARLCSALSIGGMRCDLAELRRKVGLKTRIVVSGNDGLIVNSQKCFRDIAATGWVSPKRVFLLRNVIDLEAWPASQNTDARVSSCVVYVGSLLPQKRVDVFLMALRIARQSHPQLTGIIVGDGPERVRLEKLAAKLNLTPNVRFLGAREDVASILQRVGVLVLCSESEGCPNAILEAMAARLPVVSTAVGDVPDVVQHAVSGFVVPEGSPFDIAQRILILARSPELGRRMGLAGRAIVAQQYGIDGLGNSLLSVYGSIAKLANKKRIVEVLNTCVETNQADRNHTSVASVS